MPYSLSAASAEELRRSQEQPREWAHGFAAMSPGVWLWRTAAAVAALGEEPTLRYPAAPPELEAFVEYAAKALRAREPLPLRLAAQGLGRTVVPLLLDLDPQPAVRNRREAVEAALALRVAPAGWRNDLPVLHGLAPASDETVRAAAERVGFGVLRLLRETGSRVGDAQPELSRYLHDGTLERHLDRARCYPGIP
ncbi:MAG TPA: hypothetical protein VFL60_11000 [Gaiellaceae bacterium]|nr:hypothetical protein [Gaiellaceae bacterium]